ncbi:MAG: glycosyltransferase family 1 protein [Myxococcales bacterium]|nr:glycosyltransferase family 1 protein [Myxococcales bacterium]
MRIVLTTWGTSGDLEPFLAIAAALKARGAEVVIFTNPYFAEQVERKGIEVKTFGASWSPVGMAQNAHLAHPHFGPVRVWQELYAPRMLPLFEEVSSYLKEHEVDLVLNHLWCFGGHYAARQAGVPTGFVTLAPVAWFSADEPSYVGPLRAARWFRSFSMRYLIRNTIRAVFGRSLQQIFAQVGIPLSKEAFLSASLDCACNIGLWSPAWRGEVGDDPPNAWIYGFPLGTGAVPALDEKIETFLQQGDAPVVMGLGSALPTMAPELYVEALKACRALKQRVILVGAPDGLVGSGSKDALVVPYAPYRALFPRAKVLIHHGGIGTLAEALATGKPSVILPFANDQYDNAFYSQDLGVAVAVPRIKVNATRMLGALRRCLEDRELRAKAQALGLALQAETCGAERVAEAIMAGKAR